MWKVRTLLPSIVLISAVAAQGALTVTPGPTIEVGVLAPGTTRTNHLTLKNAGAAPLLVNSVEVECTCTSVEFKPVTLEAGKTLDLPVMFKPPATDDGLIRRSITIHTSDPKEASLKIPLTAMVTKSAGIWPPQLQSTLPQRPGTDVELSLELVNVSDQPLVPLYATGPVDGPKLTVPHAPIPGGGKVTLNAKWHLPSKEGLATGQLILYVDHPQLTQISIPYQAAVQATPPSLSPAAASTQAAAGTPDATQPTVSLATIPRIPQPELTINLDLKENIPLKDFVDIVATQLKLNLVYEDAALNVPVSIRLNGPLPSDALLPLLKTLLQAKGLALVPTDRPEILRIVTSREAQSLAEPGQSVGTSQIVVEFITPKSVDLETAAGILRTFLTTGVGQITPVPRVKSLIVTDYAGQVAKLRRLMDLVDKPQETARVEVVALQSAEAGPLTERITKLLVQIAKAEGRSAFDNVFLSASEEGPGGRSITVVGPEGELARVTDLIRQFDKAPATVRIDYPASDQQKAAALDTIRQVLGTTASTPSTDGSPRIITAPQRISVLATEGQHQRLKELLTGINGKDDGSGVQLKAYPILNRNAAEIYATLTRLIGDSRGVTLTLDTPGRMPQVSPDGISRVNAPETSKAVAPESPRSGVALSSTTITIDEGTNTLLIGASPDAHRRMADLIAQLDRKQPQVLLEVMLVSVADSETFAAAVEAAVKANIGGSTIGVGTDAGIGGGDFIKGRTPTVGSGLNAAIFNPASFSLFLRALQQSNKAHISSVPQVLALDNKPALLRSIQQEPFTSVNASTTVATTSFGGFAEAGTTLEMTPHIAPADYLNLEYRMEVSSFTGSSSGNGVPPPRRSDAITSFVSVPDGSTVVLGGLRSSNVSTSVAKVPGLGEIPVLGWIGRNQNDVNNSAAFYVFVRPTILRAAKFEDLKAASVVSKHAAGITGDYPETSLRYMVNP